MMAETEHSRAFMVEVRYRKGKEGKSAYITLPLAVRNLFNLKEGQILTLSIWSVEDPKSKDKDEKKK